MTEERKEIQPISVTPVDIPEDITGSFFARGMACKVNNLEEFFAVLDRKDTVQEERCVVHLSDEDFDDFSSNLMRDYDFLTGMGATISFAETPYDGQGLTDEEYWAKLRQDKEALALWRFDACSLVTHVRNESGTYEFFVDPQGYDYPRYVLGPEDEHDFERLRVLAKQLALSHDICAYQEGSKALHDILQEMGFEVRHMTALCEKLFQGDLTEDQKIKLGTVQRTFESFYTALIDSPCDWVSDSGNELRFAAMKRLEGLENLRTEHAKNARDEIKKEHDQNELSELAELFKMGV